MIEIEFVCDQLVKRDINLNATTYKHICKRSSTKNADSTNSLRLPLTICGIRLQLQIPQQLNLTIHISYYLFVDSTNCSGFSKNGFGFQNFAYFRSDFEQYKVLGICLWNRKQQRRSKQSSSIADSATNLISACWRICFQCTESTVWPRIDGLNFWPTNYFNLVLACFKTECYKKRFETPVQKSFKSNYVLGLLECMRALKPKAYP